MLIHCARLSAILSLLIGGPSLHRLHADDDAVHVLIWDEQQAQQLVVYSDYLGEQIASALSVCEGIEVRSVTQDDPDQGLSDDNLDWADVLIWWGHVRQGEITPEIARDKVVSRVLEGELALIALHSAHWSTPFMECMNERTRLDARERYANIEGQPEVVFEFIDPPGRMPPSYDSLVTPAFYALKTGGHVGRVRVDLPNCCFPAYRPDGEPSTITVLMPDHPIAAGLPETFTIPHTEMYDEPFHVPEPDAVIFREDWELGESFRSGCLWELGEGHVFYFRPGHETFDVYLQPEPLQVLENASRWLKDELAD
jgi:trehalose utilization protein